MAHPLGPRARAVGLVAVLALATLPLVASPVAADAYSFAYGASRQQACAAPSSPATPATATSVAGAIVANTTWSSSPILVTGDVVVHRGYTLKIQPGVEVRFYSAKGLYIRGALNATGTAASHVVFRPANASETWSGVVVNAGNGGRAVVRYAEFHCQGHSTDRTFSALHVDGSTMAGGPVVVEQSYFHNNTQAIGGNQWNWHLRIANSVFRENWCGVYGGWKIIRHSAFVNNNVGACDLSNANVYGTTFTGNGVGVRGGYGELKKNTFTANGLAIHNTHSGGFAIAYNTITGNQVGVVASPDTTMSPFRYNAIHSNSRRNFNTSGSYDRSIPNNWWGTNVTADIDAKIHDGLDEVTLGLVSYRPFLSAAGSYSLPGIPTGLSAAQAPSAVLLRWTAPASTGGVAIEKYRIYRAGPEGIETLAWETRDAATTFRDTYVNASAAYTYRVSAVTDAGEGEPSASASITAVHAASEPATFKVTPGPVGGALTLNWTAPNSTGGAALVGYRVYRNQSWMWWNHNTTCDQYGCRNVFPVHGNLRETPYRDVGAAVTSLVDRNLTPGWNYYYVVVPLTGVGEGTPSRVQWDQVWPPPWEPLNFTTRPGPGDGEITLSWNPPNKREKDRPILEYRVYRGAPDHRWYFGPQPSGQPLGSNGTLLAVTKNTSYVDGGHKRGESFSYRVTAVSEAGEGQWSWIMHGNPPDRPAAPYALSAKPGSGAGEAVISWTAPQWTGGVPLTGYRIWRSNGTSWDKVGEVGNQTSFTDKGLPNGARPMWKVAAVNPVGESDAFETVSTSVSNLPAAPPNVRAGPGPDAGSILLTWQAPPSTPEVPTTSYKVYEVNADGSLTLVDTATDTRYVDGGLAAGTERKYQVSADNTWGEGAKSPAATGKAAGAPNAPTGLVVSAIAPGTLALKWTPPTLPAATSYKVYKVETNGEATVVATVTEPRYEDKSLPPGSSREYKVAGVNAGGEGPKSGAVTGKAWAPPEPPQQLAAVSGPSKGEIDLAWQAPANDGGTPITGYKIYRKAEGNGTTEQLVKTVPPGTSVHRDTGLNPGGNYVYRIAAENAVGEGTKSSEAKARAAADTTGTVIPSPGAWLVALGAVAAAVLVGRRRLP